MYHWLKYKISYNHDKDRSFHDYKNSMTTLTGHMVLFVIDALQNSR